MILIFYYNIKEADHERKLEILYQSRGYFSAEQVNEVYITSLIRLIFLFINKRAVIFYLLFQDLKIKSKQL